MHSAAGNRYRLAEELAAVLQGQSDSAWFRAPLHSRPEMVPTGIVEIDRLTGGIPKGHLTEIIGTSSSGRTSLMLSLLARLSSQHEVVSFIDPGNTFDPVSAEAFGIHLDHLLWVRAGRSILTIHQVLKATDLLLQGGGFGLIGVDLSDLPAGDVQRISSTPWVRLQRAAENTPTILLFLNREHTLKHTAALSIQLDTIQTDWSGRFLREIRPGVRVMRSRHHPQSGQQIYRFPLYPVACIEAGHIESTEATPVGQPSPGVAP